MALSRDQLGTAVSNLVYLRHGYNKRRSVTSQKVGNNCLGVTRCDIMHEFLKAVGERFCLCVEYKVLST